MDMWKSFKKVNKIKKITTQNRTKMANEFKLNDYGYEETNAYTTAYEGTFQPMADPVKDPEINFMNMFRHECGNKTSMGLESRNLLNVEGGVPTNGEGTMPKTEWYNVNEFPINSEE